MMKYSIYNRNGLVCCVSSEALAYKVCLEYLRQHDNYENLKEELDISFYNNSLNFGVRNYIWTVGSDKDEGKMGC